MAVSSTTLPDTVTSRRPGSTDSPRPAAAAPSPHPCGRDPVVGPLHPAQQRRDPGDQFAHAERLGEVVVRADTEADQQVGLVVARRQHQHGHRTVALNPSAHLVTVEAGQHHVEDDQVGAEPFAQRHAGRAVVCDLHAVALGLQAFGHRGRDRDLVLDHRDRRRVVHAATVGTGCRAIVAEMCESGADGRLSIGPHPVAGLVRCPPAPPPDLEIDVNDRSPSGPEPEPDTVAARRAYARSLRLLGELIDGPPPADEMLEHLLAVALAAAPGLTAASVTAREDDGSMRTAASTDVAASLVDRHEYESEEGPCYAAIATGRETLVDDVATDPRWPGFNGQAAACGFGSAAGLPLGNDGETLGALNVFGARPGDLDLETLDTLRRLVPPLSAALHRARAARRYQRLLDDGGFPSTR